jgi:iron complex transport system substrate-binding protein
MRQKPYKRTFFILLLSIIILHGSGLAESRERAITDMAGRKVLLPADINRVVGIGPGSLRVLVYLQATPLVVGVEDTERKDFTKPYLIANPQLAKLPSIGPMHGGEAELITVRKPDVIFWTYTNAGKADALQRKTGVPVVVLNYGDFDDKKRTFYNTLRVAGDVLHKSRRAEELIVFIEETIADLERRTKPAVKDESVYIGGIAYRGLYGINSTEPSYAPFKFVNAKNAASEIGLDHVIIDKEQLIRWNPKIIFIDGSGYSLVANELTKGSALAETLRAVKSGDLYRVLPYNWYSTNFESVLINAYYIGKVLYPEEFKDVQPVKIADQIYGFFVGKGVYAEMKRLYGGFGKIEW